MTTLPASVGDDGFLGAVEQDDAELILQSLYLHAERGLRHETALRRPGKAAAVGDLDQILSCIIVISQMVVIKAKV